MENTVLCPLDGRYAGRLGTLRACMGESALAACRVRVELAWLEVLSSLKLPHCPPLTAAEKKLLGTLGQLSAEDLALLHALEFNGYKHIAATKHDVKAVEYFLRLRFDRTPLKKRQNWLHFALTSEDVNSVSYALMLSDGLEKELFPLLLQIQQSLLQLARREARSVLLARTHGQPAVPTTFGKEIRVFADRLSRQIEQLRTRQISCKFGGAVGNFNAHAVAFPSVNWSRTADRLVGMLNKGRKIKIVRTVVSTQVDPRDTYAELFDNLRRTNVILIDFCRDMWQYISAGLVRQRVIAGEVGSSTMPQKVNPIDFENAEGNLQLANTLCDFLANKLPVSRLQRDLTDSTVLRNMAVVFGYMAVAYGSIVGGLHKTAFDRASALQEVKAHPEVLAEAFQTMLRAAGIKNPYEKLRDFTRGHTVAAVAWRQFIDQLEISRELKSRMQALKPEDYIGLAEQLARGK